MSIPKPLESELLAVSEGHLSECLIGLQSSQKALARIQILEHVSGLISGIPPQVFRRIFGEQLVLSKQVTETTAKKICLDLQSNIIPPSLALCSLAQPVLGLSERKRSGVYYTDSRLAVYLASEAVRTAGNRPTLLDPAAGSGILLVAVVLTLFPSANQKRDSYLSTSVFAADMSSLALRGALLALASLATQYRTVEQLASHLRCADSLMLKQELWQDVAPQGFDLVVGNPPWEKLKVSAHEVYKGGGVNRSYGEIFKRIPKHLRALHNAKAKRTAYSAELSQRYHHQGAGEADLYKFFIELSVDLVKPGGNLCLFVPGGLIRSQGTYALRQLLSESCADIRYTILENRSRFFAIDTRFKFLLLQARVDDQDSPAKIRIGNAKVNGREVTTGSEISITTPVLQALRPDLSIPEVRTKQEWHLFQKLSQSFPRFGEEESRWHPKFCREVDMTKDKNNFRKRPGEDLLPLIEGRMVQHFNSATKAYVNGQGRSAKWRSTYFDANCALEPQFYYPRSHLSAAVLQRIEHRRVGFCDITGQTNERSMLASWIPADVVCGNKVPTILFGNLRDSEPLGNCWLGIANSFVFDWLLRRVVTTTVNYFLLANLPIPQADLSNTILFEIGSTTKRLSNIPPSAHWAYAELRAHSDLLVAKLYGVEPSELALILEDFPLLDRHQPTIWGEKRSTITRDFLLSRAQRSTDDLNLKARITEAQKVGAVPYVPSHLGSIALEAQSV